ncbi:hypothetical protein THAOC_11074 [Thalassiosira oceanica]|uniref:J domain-containing protein n=1 Tax=Thalassiosira oceanica TaxID=159749 RepID=K0SR14_THAOC|nr:hypothetical protein THAOC_11074 [Thalassiosira oceanica]|eukprot:EJK67835.1 hypothetical protein THAOC_11074 [Thalassiosira oceanica]
MPVFLILPQELVAWFLENEPTAFELYEKLVGLYETDVMPEEFELACDWCLCGCNEKVKLRQSLQVALFSPKEKTCASWFKQRVATLLGPSPNSAPRTTPAMPPTPGPQPTAATPAVTPSPQKANCEFAPGGLHFVFDKLGKGISILQCRGLPAQEASNRQTKQVAANATQAAGNLMYQENLVLLKRDPADPAADEKATLYTNSTDAGRLGVEVTNKNHFSRVLARCLAISGPRSSHAGDGAEGRDEKSSIARDLALALADLHEVDAVLDPNGRILSSAIVHTDISSDQTWRNWETDELGHESLKRSGNMPRAGKAMSMVRRPPSSQLQTQQMFGNTNCIQTMIDVRRMKLLGDMTQGKNSVQYPAMQMLIVFSVNPREAAGGRPLKSNKESLHDSLVRSLKKAGFTIDRFGSLKDWYWDFLNPTFVNELIAFLKDNSKPIPRRSNPGSQYTYHPRYSSRHSDSRRAEQDRDARQHQQRRQQRHEDHRRRQEERRRQQQDHRQQHSGMSESPSRPRPSSGINDPDLDPSNMEWNLNLGRAHKVLGNLGRNATSREIKMAYRLESRRWHPDHHVGKSSFKEAESRMQTINAAYEYLRELTASGWTKLPTYQIKEHCSTAPPSMNKKTRPEASTHTLNYELWMVTQDLQQKIMWQNSLDVQFSWSKPAQNPGSLKSEETRLENFRAGQLVALASLVLFQSTLQQQHRFSEHNLKRETRTWQKDKPETP